ncbi:MAG: hypothetical protein A2896_03065 [Candidatus Nealsonbacteria bacterium RIFCSPLOWO2_01_FULL_43_32]|uniref:Phage tail collar domain-containing protein n=1 Tax=Candidatus Nealsonbacteria bacterium RIFCSPLOWO2_01_FULL_43_32 TaxID=1801672 RepID=A0A1G2EDR6_9BACT|nr:MAG: hypothetical protein A2896_03065 [Candidatus Nealsonbacteria bacterium RIFCSPLOWO2_01_FULL_43_32]
MNMRKQIFSKISSYFPQILALLLLSAFAAYGWTEPTQAPPGGNVATPLNTSNIGQSKEGGLILNTGGATNGLVIDKGNLCLGADCRGSWPVAGAIPSGMIAMFDTSCPAGWTRFAALDNKFPQGAATYGGTGGASTHTHGYTDKMLGTPGGAGPQISSSGSACGEYGSRIFTVEIIPGGGDGAPTCSSASRTTGSGDNMPPYLNVIWCKKD